MADARAALMALGAVLVLSSAVPYMLSIAGGRTRPRIFSWVIWTLLGVIATTAAYIGGEFPSAALTAAATVETGSIVALGWKYGNRDFERLDAYCLAGVLMGLALWAGYDSPLLGLTAALAIDALAAVPTLRHAWRRPHEEAAIAYAMCAVASLCVLAAMPEYTLLGLLYPVYLLTVNAVIAAIVIRRAQLPVSFRLARPTAPGTALGTDRSEPAPLPGSQAAMLTYGRHAAPVATAREHKPRPKAPPRSGVVASGRRAERMSAVGLGEVPHRSRSTRRPRPPMNGA